MAWRDNFTFTFNNFFYILNKYSPNESCRVLHIFRYLNYVLLLLFPLKISHICHTDIPTSRKLNKHKGIITSYLYDIL